MSEQLERSSEQATKAEAWNKEILNWASYMYGEFQQALVELPGFARSAAKQILEGPIYNVTFQVGKKHFLVQLNHNKRGTDRVTGLTIDMGEDPETVKSEGTRLQVYLANPQEGEPQVRVISPDSPEGKDASGKINPSVNTIFALNKAGHVLAYLSEIRHLTKDLEAEIREREISEIRPYHFY